MTPKLLRFAYSLFPAFLRQVPREQLKEKKRNKALYFEPLPESLFMVPFPVFESGFIPATAAPAAPVASL